MAKKTIVQLMDIYVKEAKTGRSKEDIEDDLRKTGASEEEIKEVKRSINRLGLLVDMDSAHNSRHNEQRMIGWVLFFGGILATVLTYTGIWGLGNYIIIAWGPVLVGMTMIFRGRQRKRS